MPDDEFDPDQDAPREEAGDGGGGADLDEAGTEADDVDADANQVRYRVLQPDTYSPPDDHEHLGDDEYLSPTPERMDMLEGAGLIEVLDWDYEPDTSLNLSGPPEVVIDDDGQRIVSPNEVGDRIRSVNLGTWRCERCGCETFVPPSDGQLVAPHECEYCERQGPFIHVLADEMPDNPAAFSDPAWHTPSSVSDERYDQLWHDVRDWIHTNWVTPEDELYDGLTAFAISTWLRPNLEFVPHLMVMGKFESGKTRLLQTLARVSYRGIVPVSFTAPALFRTIDAYNITLFLSEYHDLNDDMLDEVNGVIKGSQKRGEEVMRVEPNPAGGYDPVNFDIFTHMGVATQFSPPDDIISRCIEVTTRPAARDVPPTFKEQEARATDIRDRLLYARYRLLDSPEWDDAEREAVKWLNGRGISGRLREKMWGLVTVAVLWGELDAIKPFVEAMHESAEKSTEDSDDAVVIQCIRDLAFEEVEATPTLGNADPWEGITIPLKDVRDRFNTMTDRDVSASYIGQVRNRLGVDKKRMSNGTVIADEDLERKLRELCEQNNLGWEKTEASVVVEELQDDNKYKSSCSECGEIRTLTHRHAVDGYHMCPDCAEELEEVHARRDDGDGADGFTAEDV